MFDLSDLFNSEPPKDSSVSIEQECDSILKKNKAVKSDTQLKSLRLEAHRLILQQQPNIYSFDENVLLKEEQPKLSMNEFFEKFSSKYQQIKPAEPSTQITQLLLQKGISKNVLGKKPTLSLENTDDNLKIVPSTSNFYGVRKKASMDVLRELFDKKQLEQQIEMKKIKEAAKQKKDELSERDLYDEPMVSKGRIIVDASDEVEVEGKPIKEQDIKDPIEIISDDGDQEEEYESECKDRCKNESEDINALEIELAENEVVLLTQETSDETDDEVDDLLEGNRLLDLISQKFATKKKEKLEQTKQKISHFLEEEAEVEDEYGNLISEEEENDEQQELNHLEKEMKDSKFVVLPTTLGQSTEDRHLLSELHRYHFIYIRFD